MAKELQSTGSTVGSTGECIAAAFVLNRQDLLPGSRHDIVEAWDRLDSEWQGYVRDVKHNLMHLVNQSE